MLVLQDSWKFTKILKILKDYFYPLSALITNDFGLNYVYTLALGPICAGSLAFYQRIGVHFDVPDDITLLRTLSSTSSGSEILYYTQPNQVNNAFSSNKPLFCRKEISCKRLERHLNLLTLL